MEKKMMPKESFTRKNDQFICEKCGGTGWIIHRENIADYGPADFATPCPDCMRHFREVDETGIPLQYAEADLPGFDFEIYDGFDLTNDQKLIWDFFENFRQWQANGMGLYFFSKTPGSGKTLLACSVARSISLKYNIQTRFITSTDYLAVVGDGYHRDWGTGDASAIYRACNLLVLDDLGAEKSGDWQNQEIYKLINDRINTGKITIITSNLAQKKLELNARTVDRIISCTFPIALPEISIRRKKAEEKRQQTVSQILQAG